MNKKNIIIMCCISFLQGMVFYASISTLYRQACGISLFQMGIIESVLAIFVLVFEIPWGIICNYIGYKKTLIICNLIYFISKIIFYYATSFEMFLLERVLLAIVLAGLSGCDTAILYESIKKEDSTRIFGFYHACGTLGVLISSLLFSIFIQDQLKRSALWTIFPYGIAFLLTLGIQDIPMKKESTRFSLKDLSSYQKSIQKVFLFLISVALFTETTHTLGSFYNQLQYEKAMIPIHLFGILYMLMNIISLVNISIGKITHIIKEEKLIKLLYITSAIVCFILMATSNPFLSVLGIALLQISEALIYPMMDTILNRNVICHRSITLSLFSMITNITIVGCDLTFGKFGDIDVSYAFFIGGIFMICGFLIYSIWEKHQV
ncbi:MAG: MFS transporter [Traorella sp.]